MTPTPVLDALSVVAIVICLAGIAWAIVLLVGARKKGKSK